MNKWFIKTVSLLALGSLTATDCYANYAAAQAARGRRDYVNAAAGFYSAMANPRDSAEKAKSEWGLAESLYDLGLLYSASKNYTTIIRRGYRPDNPFFRNALERLGAINSTISLGQSHIVQLFKAKIDPVVVPGPAQGFYFYYLGMESFQDAKYERAESLFERVPSSSAYYLRALFHLAVVANLQGKHSQSIGLFQKVAESAGRDDNGDELRELAHLNMARVYYETKKFRQSIEYYSRIPRGVENNWLDAIWEASWAFFLMQKHNNALGNIHTIHSPFFNNRFFPESYVLQAVTYLRLCRYDEVKDSLKKFRERYSPVFADIRSILDQAGGKPRDFFGVVYQYRIGSLSRYKNAWEILDKLSRTDAYREARETVRFADRELARLADFGGRWKQNGLMDELGDFLNQKKGLAVSDAGRRLERLAREYFSYLKDLSEQTRLIQAEQMLGKIDQLRSELNIGTADRKVSFIGGMQELNVGDQLEYWPFQGEYWEDELGGYVYNIPSKCKGSDKEK